MSLSSFFGANFNRNNRKVNKKRAQNFNGAALIEQFENRILLSAEMPMDISELSDEFDDASTIENWQRVNETEGWNAEQLNLWDIDQSQEGRMVMQPHTVVWYENWRGPMAFKEVTGDFVITSEVHISDRDDIGNSDPDNIPSDGQFSLGGVMVRTPRDITDPSEWTPGSQQNDGTNDGENYVFLSFGYAFGNGENQFGLEVKTTRNSNSDLEVLPMGTETNTITIQTARIGDTIITMYQRPGEDWQVRSRYSRPDMPDTLQVGLVTYSDWGKARDFDPFFHNGNVLTPDIAENPTPEEAFNPDLTAGFEYARYARPDIPVELQNTDLTSPEVTDEQILSFLGEHANIDPGGNADPATVSVSALTERFVEGSSGGEGFLITRQSDSIDEDLTVNFILEGNAAYDSDYTTSTTSSIIIPAGETSTTLVLDIINDDEEENAEEIRLRLLSGTGYTTDESYQATVEIRDDDTQMAIGTNLSRNVDWDSAWIFKDAFQRSRPWRAMAVNTETGQQVWQDYVGEGPELQVDENGWIAELPTWTASDGTVYQQTARTAIFTTGVPVPSGIYRAEWDGNGEIQMGYVVESGVTEEGRNYALVEMPEDLNVNYTLTITSTDPDDPIRNINFWMPDYNGESMVIQDWQPGDETSPFHPLFIERLSGFETIRFMDWQTTNYNGELDQWEERSQITDASQANMTGDYDTIVSGVSLEYMIQLANELGADPWFNMPHQANDEFVENFATTVRDTLDPELNVYVEWSNELWNAHFPTRHWVTEQMSLPENEGLDFFQVTTNEIRRDFNIWSDVFSGQEDRLVRVVAGQQNNPWVMSQLAANMEGEFDAISSTAYFGLSADFIANADETTTADEIIDSLIEESIPAINERLIAHQAIADHYSAELGREIQYVTYESGSHVFEYNTALFGSSAEAAGVEAMYSPRMYDVYQIMLNEVRDIGIDLYNEFIFTGRYGASPYGSYGLLFDMEQPVEEAYQYQALQDFVESQNPAVALPQVSVHATNASGNEQGDHIVFTFTRTEESLASELTVNYDLSGTAIAGEDYTAPGSTIQFNAGETTATLTIIPVDDSQVEGTETISVQIQNHDSYQLGDSISAEATLGDNDYLFVENQTISHLEESLTIDLPATHPDGTALEYSASVAGLELYHLNQEYQFHTNGNYYQNYHGSEERWIQGDGNSWFYLLSTGELGRWEGSFEDSPVIAELSPEVYDNPLLLIESTLPATISQENHQLLIEPSDNFLGDFEIELSVTNGTTSQTQLFTVSVVNEAPVIEEIPNQMMERNSNPLTIPVIAFDPDGEEIELTVSVVDPAYQLDQEQGFWSEGEYYTNNAGQQEKWIRNQDNRWFYLLPDGQLHRWNGGFDQSEFIADLGTEVYDNPALLTEAEAIPITVSLEDGTITITPDNNYVGEFQVLLEATDGVNQTTREFSVSVTNEAPTLAPFENQSSPAGETLIIPLIGDDSNGDELIYSAFIEQSEEYQLDQAHGFHSDNNYHTNHAGQQEKWIQNENNRWHYILPNGELYQWNGSFEASTLVAELNSNVYEDPTLLTEAQPVELELEIVGNELHIHSPETTTGFVQIIVTVSDGHSSTSQILNLELLDPHMSIWTDLELLELGV